MGDPRTSAVYRNLPRGATESSGGALSTSGARPQLSIKIGFEMRAHGDGRATGRRPSPPPRQVARSVRAAIAVRLLTLLLGEFLD